METAGRPNLFIVGAPKCGTTSMHTYLAQHPDVFMSARKEPCYLAPDFDAFFYPQSDEEYLALFADATDERYVGESTTTYLYSREAARAIAAYSPDARIVVMLRRPSEMIYALHAQRVFEKAEDIADFRAALDAEEPRRRGESIPAGLVQPAAYLQYRAMGRYADQLQRYLDVFPRERIHVIVYDDLRADTPATFAALCRFLDLPDSDAIRFDIHDWEARVRGRAVARLVFSRPSRWAAARLPDAVKRAVRPLWQVRETKQRRAPMADDLRRELDAYFREDVRRVGEMLGRNLSHWTP